MIPVIRTTGNSRPHIVHPGYNRTPRLSGKLLPMERPEGELTWWQGAALLIFTALVVLGLTLAFGS